MATPTEILTAGGLVNADLIVQAAQATSVPLAILAAMVQKESGGQNIYGRDGKDTDSPGVYANLYPLQVTQQNFTAFRAAVLAGQKSNGVGPSQITYPGYWKQYPDYPFWDVLSNLKFGATLLMDLLDGDYLDASISSAGAHYNGGTNPNGTALAYGADLLARTKIWRARLAGASELGGSMPKVFLSPSDQDNNPVDGGGNEQRYAQLRCARAAEVLRAHGVTVKVSEAGIGDDTNGYVASVKEGEAWGPDIYVADHTNATGNAAVKRSGVQAYCWLGDPNSKRLGECINARMDPIVPGGASIQDGSNLYEVSGPSMTAVLMESGYHDNPVDAAMIRTKTTEMGEALAYGILDYFGIQTTTPSEDNMPSAEDVARAVWEQPVDLGLPDGTTQTEKAGLWIGWANRHALTASERAEQALANQAAQNAKIDALTARLNSISSVTETPAPAPALTPDQLAAAQAALDALASVFNGLAGK